MNTIAASSRASGKTLLVMAAGTGGHIFPGLAIAEEMQRRGWNIVWLGTETGMENQLVSARQIPLLRLNFTGMRGKGIAHVLSGAAKLLRAIWMSWVSMRRLKPDVVLGMGGYVTVPGGLAARCAGRPLVLMNADAGILLSNRLLSPFAQALLFGLPARQAHTAKACVPGNPVRQDIARLPQPAARFIGRSGPLRILVVGGSLGARALNECVPRALALLPEEARPQVTHQAGKAHLSALHAAYQEAGVRAEVLDFIHDMPARYAEADLVICRSGAMTISELTAAGVASALVPFVASSTSHQRENALWLSEQGAAHYFAPETLTPERLAHFLSLLDRDTCLQMSQRAYALGRREATFHIADILEQHS